MKSFQHEIEQLNQRLDNVQKQNRRFKKITSLLCLCIMPITSNKGGSYASLGSRNYFFLGP